MHSTSLSRTLGGWSKPSGKGRRRRVRLRRETAMRQVFDGAALLIAGIAALIEAHTHHPVASVGVPGAVFRKTRLEPISPPRLDD